MKMKTNLWLRYIGLLFLSFGFIGFNLIGAQEIGTKTLNEQFDAHPTAMMGFMSGFGGRYDDLRMCVASPAGAKGGIIAEFISFNVNLRPNRRASLDINIPIGRALLFATAFQMLQWSPDITTNFHIQLKQKLELLIGSSFGLAFHYGPDFKTDKDDPNRVDFFAMGPKFSILIALAPWNPHRRFQWKIGVRTFFEYFKGESNRKGLSVGAILESYFLWILF
jgi:hypothetical protein